MYTAEIFTRYINQIKSPEVKNIVKRGLAECPEEFYTMAASTTGKYHTLNLLLVKVDSFVIR